MTFKKGNIPWTKGLSKEEILRRRPNEKIKTLFKKGYHTWNDGMNTEEFKKHYPNGFYLEKKGRTPWNKGKTFEELYGKEKAEKMKKEHNDKIRGREHTEEERKKISEGLIGHKGWNTGLTMKTHPSLIKVSQAKKGSIPPQRGKTFEEFYGIEKAKELKKRHSESIKRNLRNINSPEARKKISKALIGHPVLEITKQKIKQARAKQIFPIKDTKIEVKIQMFLKELGYEFFTHQYIKEIEHSYQCDILIPTLNLVVECDGNYWHKYPIGKDIDHIRTKELLQKGFKVLRLWENEIVVMDINKFKDKLNNIHLSTRTKA